MQTCCSCSLPFSSYAKIVNGATHTCTDHDITEKLYMLSCYSKQELTQLTVIYLCLGEKFVLVAVVSSCIESGNYIAPGTPYFVLCLQVKINLILDCMD
jgi:hypothetical protein